MPVQVFAAEGEQAAEDDTGGGVTSPDREEAAAGPTWGDEPKPLQSACST